MAAMATSDGAHHRSRGRVCIGHKLVTGHGPACFGLAREPGPVPANPGGIRNREGVPTGALPAAELGGKDRNKAVK